MLQLFICREEVNFSQKELDCLLDTLRELIGVLDQASKSVQIPLPKLKIEIKTTKLKESPFANR